MFVSVSSMLMAQDVTEEQAFMVCEHFLLDQSPQNANLIPNVKLQEIISDEEGMVCLYRFSIGEQGFVIVSASQSVMPILAYSFENDFKMIPPVSDLFHLYKQVIRFTKEGRVPVSPSAVATWNRYLSEDFTPKTTKSTTTGYLLTTSWDQSKFYNTYCPWDAESGSTYDNRVPNGCVAVATAQVMNYYRFPRSASGSTSYVPSGYERQTVNFAAHTYNWDAMCNKPTSYANEISKLIYHIGVAVNMSYSPTGSGADNGDLRRQLIDRFNFNPDIRIIFRDRYPGDDVEQYINLLKSEIDNRHPVIYAGAERDGTGAHEFLLDGYDNDDKFHLNFGWGGNSNGFYALDHFVTPSNGTYDYFSQAMINCYPKASAYHSYCEDLKTQTASFGYVADGSPITQPYPARPSCSWLIAAPDAKSYTFKFDRLDLFDGADYVTIYNGPTVESGIKVTLTGSSLPAGSYTVLSDSVLITFSNMRYYSENTNHYGFQISYSSNVESPYCSRSRSISDWNAVIEDGSPEGSAYRAQSNCSWYLNLSYVTGYYYSFPKFDLGSGDFVDIYDATSSPDIFYKRYDIHHLPTGTEQVNFKKMRIVFISDNWDQKDGFKFEYYAISNVDDLDGMENISVYPNPVSNNLSVDFSMTDASTVNFRLMDATGKLVAADNMQASCGNNKFSMNVSRLPKGFYMLEISSPKGKTVRKVMVQ